MLFRSEHAEFMLEDELGLPLELRCVNHSALTQGRRGRRLPDLVPSLPNSKPKDWSKRKCDWIASESNWMVCCWKDVFFIMELMKVAAAKESIEYITSERSYDGTPSSFRHHSISSSTYSSSLSVPQQCKSQRSSDGYKSRETRVGEVVGFPSSEGT